MLLRPYPVHITTWLDMPRCVTGIEARSGAEKAADTPCGLKYAAVA